MDKNKSRKCENNLFEKFHYTYDNFTMELWVCFCFLFFVYFSFSPQPPERTQMFVTSRLLEMGFSMRHIYWAMEAAGTALWSV